jgi:hypothetical protein
MLEASNTPISELFYNKGFISHDDGDGDGRDGHDQMDTASGPLHVVEQDSVMGPLEEMEVEDGGSSQLEYSKEKAMNDGEIDDDIIIEIYDAEDDNDDKDDSIDNAMEEQSQRKVEHTQCQRLRHCIQGAVASLIENDDTRKEWTALRVKLLLSLIPQNPTYPLGIYMYVLVLPRVLISLQMIVHFMVH